MAHYVITLDGTDYVGKGWSEQDAIESAYDQAGKGWESIYDMPVDAIRPATVREAMTAEYGVDWQKHGPSHCFDIENNYRTDHKDVLIVRGTAANDCHGYDEPVSVSNYRVLYERWSHLDGLSRGPWSNADYITLDLDSEAPEDLTEVLDGLADYPVIDEQAWSEVEQEMIQDHWESYGKSEVIRAVEKALDVDELTDDALDIIERLVWEGIIDYGHGGGYPTMVDASACDFGDEDIATFIRDHAGTVYTFDRYGQMITLDMTSLIPVEA